MGEERQARGTDRASPPICYCFGLVWVASLPSSPLSPCVYFLSALLEPTPTPTPIPCHSPPLLFPFRLLHPRFLLYPSPPLPAHTRFPFSRFQCRSPSVPRPETFALLFRPSGFRRYLQPLPVAPPPAPVFEILSWNLTQFPDPKKLTLYKNKQKPLSAVDAKS